MRSGRPGEKLAKEEQDEARVVLEVAHGQTARLRDKAIDPFQPVAAHPLGPPAFVAGNKVKGRANGKHDGGNPAQVIDDPALLLGASEANKEQTRAGGGDSLDDGRVFLRRSAAGRAGFQHRQC